MQARRTVEEARTPHSPESMPVTAPAVAQRSARRATARRASNRHATARRHKDDVEERVFEYLQEHPQSTTGDMAKGLNANRDTIAAGRLHIASSSDVTKD